MQQLNYDAAKLERILSPARLSGYKTNYALQLNKEPIILYRWNIILSELLYPLLNVIEVALRNAIHTAIASHFNNENWLLDNWFLAEEEGREIQKQARYLQYRNQLDVGHLIAELNFGFWTGLLDRRYEHKQLLWPTLLRATFPYLENRKIHLIRKSFNKIRRLRNRVSHYEPIWHWQDLPQQHDQIIEVIRWIEPELIKLLEVGRFLEVYRLGPKKDLV